MSNKFTCKEVRLFVIINKIWYNIYVVVTLKKLNIKQKNWILLLISIFLICSFSVLIIIGAFSNKLIIESTRFICIILLILATILGVVATYNIIKNKRRRLFKTWQNRLFSILIGLYAVGCCSFLFILYGPFPNFREWLITTAMATMNHQHYCKWFYNDEIIQKILDNNITIEAEGETDPSLIDKDLVLDNYVDHYEKELIEHEEGELYKIVKFKLNGQQAYMAAVYDASRITVGISKFYPDRGQYVSTMAKAYKAPLAINGGGFTDPNGNSTGGTPMGVTIANGKVITGEASGMNEGGVIGFTNNGILVLKKNTNTTELLNMGVRDAVTMGPFLIVNGEKSKFKGNGGWGVAARTAIGQRKDGIVLFLVVDSNTTRTKGATIVDLANVMEKYGCINAANLDGGTSSVMSVDGEIINDPIDSTGAHKTRGVPTIFMVK